MSRRALIRDLIEQQLAAANSGEAPATPAAPEPRAAPGPVRAVGLTLDRMEAERRALETQLAAGARVVEIDPALVQPSFAADRFGGGDEAAFRALKASIEASGQEVPILVRPLPGAEGRYQIAYGHRRWRAAHELGRPVRAIVRLLDDEALVVAQGLENAARLDLTYIEKASFAAALEGRGFERPAIMKALLVDKTELSKMLAVAAGVPGPIARAIGPAPKIGRRRWLDLAKVLEGKPAMARAEGRVQDPDFFAAETDTRFQLVFDAARASFVETKRSDLATPMPLTVRGQRLGTYAQPGGRLELVFEDGSADGFANFVLGRLDRLHEEFRASRAPKD